MRHPNFLLDTNVLVHYGRGSRVAEKIEQKFVLRSYPFKPTVSVVTLGEIESFAEFNGWNQGKRDQLAAFMSELVFAPIDDHSVIEAYAEIDVFSRRSKPSIKMGKNDLWIAATCRAGGYTLMTTDGDYDHLAGSFFEVVKINSLTGEAM